MNSKLFFSLLASIALMGFLFGCGGGGGGGSSSGTNSSNGASTQDPSNYTVAPAIAPVPAK